MNKVLTDIYGSIYLTDKAVLALQHELRKQKAVSSFLTLSLAAVCLYIWTDIKYDNNQTKRIENLEREVQRMNMGV